jgi:alpha-1,3-mannosyltransferase
MIRLLCFIGKYLVRVRKEYSDSITVSAALSVKMSILLYLPGLLVILFKRRGLATTLRLMVTISATQVLLAFAFLREDYWAYLRSSFDLSRVFLYKWTVNWRFVDEETFLSPRWAKFLLAGHISVLILFGLFTWCKADGGVWRVLSRGIQRPHLPAGLAPLNADCELSRSCPHDSVFTLRKMWLPSSLLLT